MTLVSKNKQLNRKSEGGLAKKETYIESSAK